MYPEFFHARKISFWGWSFPVTSLEWCMKNSCMQSEITNRNETSYVPMQASRCPWVICSWSMFLKNGITWLMYVKAVSIHPKIHTGGRAFPILELIRWLSLCPKLLSTYSINNTIHTYTDWQYCSALVELFQRWWHSWGVGGRDQKLY